MTKTKADIQKVLQDIRKANPRAKKWEIVGIFSAALRADVELMAAAAEMVDEIITEDEIEERKKPN